MFVCVGHCSSQMGRKNQLDESWTGVDRMSRNIDPYRIKITKVSEVVECLFC